MEANTRQLVASIVSAGIVIVTGNRRGRKHATISVDTGSASSLIAGIGRRTKRGTQAVLLARAETPATGTARVSGKIDAGLGDETGEDSVEGSEVVDRERSGVADKVDLALHDIVADTNAEHDDTGVLGLINLGAHLATAHVVASVGQKDDDPSNTGAASSLKTPKGLLNAAGNASAASALPNGVDAVDDVGPVVAQVESDTASRREQAKAHADVVGSDGVGVGDANTKVLLVTERRRTDGARLVEDQVEIDLDRALGLRAVPGRVEGEGRRGRVGNDVLEVHEPTRVGSSRSGVIIKDSTARQSGGIVIHDEDLAFGASTTGLEGSGALASADRDGVGVGAVERAGCTGIGALLVIAVDGLAESLGLALRAEQVSQLVAVIDDFLDGGVSGSADRVVDSLEVLSIVVVDLSRHGSKHVGIIVDGDVCLEVAGGLRKSANCQHGTKSKNAKHA